jgi:hypothetical protein
MGKLDDTDKYYIRFLSQLLVDDPYVSLVYHALGMMLLFMSRKVIILMHQNRMGKHWEFIYNLALQYLNFSLEISKQSLPSQHPNIETILENIGLAYEDKYEQAKTIYHHSFRQQIFPNKISNVFYRKLKIDVLSVFLKLHEDNMQHHF